MGSDSEFQNETARPCGRWSLGGIAIAVFAGVKEGYLARLFNLGVQWHFSALGAGVTGPSRVLLAILLYEQPDRDRAASVACFVSMGISEEGRGHAQMLPSIILALKPKRPFVKGVIRPRID